MAYDQFCHNCGLNFQRLSTEEEARYAQDPGYCPNCGYPLAGNYPPPTPPAPPVWSGQDSTMPPSRSKRRRNVLITIGSLLLVVGGLFVLLTSCSVIDPGRLLGAKPSPTTAMMNANSSTGTGNGTTVANGGTQGITVTETAIAGGGSGGNGGGGSAPTATPVSGSGGGGGTSPTATPSGGGGGGGNPTATPTPAPPVVVTISPTSIAVQCGNTTTIVMTNPSSTQAANWTATSVPYTISPTHGTIAPRGSQSIIVPTMTTLAPLDTVIITSGGVPQTVTITCHL